LGLSTRAGNAPGDGLEPAVYAYQETVNTGPEYKRYGKQYKAVRGGAWLHDDIVEGYEQGKSAVRQL